MSDSWGMVIFISVIWFGAWGPVIWSIKKWEEKNR